MATPVTDRQVRAAALAAQLPTEARQSLFLSTTKIREDLVVALLRIHVFGVAFDHERLVLFANDVEAQLLLELLRERTTP